MVKKQENIGKLHVTYVMVLVSHLVREARIIIKSEDFEDVQCLLNITYLTKNGDKN